MTLRTKENHGNINSDSQCLTRDSKQTLAE